MNAAQHRTGTALTLGLAAIATCEDEEELLPRTAVACAGGYCFALLPDLLEPATNPHHRQFFHSVAFAGIVGYGVYEAWKWKPETALDEWLRVLLVLAGSAYLVHLAYDATTKRSLPWVGKL